MALPDGFKNFLRQELKQYSDGVSLVQFEQLFAQVGLFLLVDEVNHRINAVVQNDSKAGWLGGEVITAKADEPLEKALYRFLTS